MHELTALEIGQVDGGVSGMQFAGYVLAFGAGSIAIATAPVWGAIAGVLAVAAVGVNALNDYAKE